MLLIKATDLNKIGSVEMGFILSIVGGWVQGIQTLNNQSSGELKEKFMMQKMSSKAQTIEKLFESSEFELFQKEAISLITDFSKNLSDTLVWIKETLPVLKKQEAVVREFGEFLSTNPKFESLEFQNAMSKTQKELLPWLHDTTGKSLYWTERRNDFGLLDPFKKFLVNAHALLDLLDVLHYAGYMNLEDDCNLPPMFIKIRY